MKKRLFLGLLPVLMALSACAGTSPKNIDEGIFEEDTQLHEEVFEDAKPVFEGKSARNLTPVGTGDPIIGIQSKVFEEEVNEEIVKYISVRFVAALSLPSDATEVRWTRTLYNDNGNYYSTKPQTTKLCEYKYQNIYDNGSSLNIKSFGNDYTHFVAYALRKIPLVEFGDYYINMSLSIDGVEYKKIVSTSINQDRQVSYNYNSDPITGYFMQGTLGGNTAAQYPCDNETQGSGNQASFTCTTESKLPLVANDSFVIFHSVYNADVTKSKFRIFGYSSLSNDDGSFCFTNDEGRMKVKEARDYTLYLSNGNQIYTAASGALSHDLYVGENIKAYTNNPDASNKVATKVDFTKNDVVSFRILGTKLHFYHNDGGLIDDGDTYTVPVTGTYYLYVNNNNQAFVSAPVTFNVTSTTVETGLSIYVSGDFNSWAISSDYKLTFSNGSWSGTFELPGGDNQEYKFVKVKDAYTSIQYWETDSRYINSSREYRSLDSTTVTFASDPQYYYVGPGDDWTKRDEHHIITDGNSNDLVISNVSLNAGDNLKVIKVVDGTTEWIANSNTWTNCGYTLDDNLVITNSGTYTIHFYLNDSDNPIGLEKTGVEPRGDVLFVGLYLRGLDGWTCQDQYQLYRHNDDIGAIVDIELEEGDVFKIGNSNWSDSYGWYGYAINGDSWTADYSDGNYPKGDDLSGYLKAASDQNNIECEKDGTYSFYINSDHQLYIYIA